MAACRASPEGDARQEGGAAWPGGPPARGSAGPRARPHLTSLASMGERNRPVTAVAGQLTTMPPAPVVPPANAPGPSWPPRLAEGVELLGAYKDSGYSQPPSLVRRADGQVIQMSPLLYQVACRIDGSRDREAIAALVSADLGRSLTADQVRYLITAKLLPLGVVAAGGVPRALPKANPLFALRARGTLLPERIVNLLGAFLRPLFQWPAVAAVVSSMLAVDWWLF